MRRTSTFQMQARTGFSRCRQGIVVLRTFSKIYGMAGLRCALRLPGRPASQARTLRLETPCPDGCCSTKTSLKHKGLILERKKINADIRSDVFRGSDEQIFLRCFRKQLFHGGCEAAGEAVHRSMEAKKVYVGRVWPAWPT